ncbi:Ankyrin repeat domain-containing protein 26 [Fukomys damarensis]|uniref:Ankyrin repeat domain-containing protein 26 n=1 Tax=Fukomys damarensis TaxID=885580 RepID=A0A091D5Z2_FUKDA|nr:Ankyrin repeat domain-containing protein 26 [Fukomys damarensis]
MDDLDDLTESCEAASESPELPYPSSEDVLLLITQLQADCKDSFSLLKIRKAVQSYKRLIELKIRCCELLRRQIEKMEDKVTGLQKELSETKELKLQLEHEKVEQEQELCNARLELENFKLKVAIEKQAEENQQLQKNLFSTNMELLSLKNIEKKYLKLQKNKKKMEQELLTLKCPIEKNGVEHGRVQQYKQEIEERERQDLAEKLQQVDQLLQGRREAGGGWQGAPQGEMAEQNLTWHSQCKALPPAPLCWDSQQQLASQPEVDAQSKLGGSCLRPMAFS